MREIELLSNPEEIVVVEKFADDIRQELSLNDDVFGNMLVALTEGVNNAIVHGNKADISKKVRIQLQRDEHALTFTITDEGEGFDFNSLPDPTAPENLEKPTGRGVFLMDHLSDLLVFSDNGSTVEMQFRI